MDAEHFRWLVAAAVEDLPEEFLDQLHNVDVVVEDRPTAAQLHRAGLRRGHTLLGLYEGVPQTRRGRGYGLVLPDKITIFQQAIEERCSSDDQIRQEVRRVVYHEIAHHFGIDDDRLDHLERGGD
jgi:predicted Zn-dependent protease with MMP-like domain